MEQIVCEQCGDVGCETELIYCGECSYSARHTYCMDVYPIPDDDQQDIATWLCELCSCDSTINNNKHPPPSRKGEEEKPYQLARVAEPLLRSAWSGSFEVFYSEDYSADLDGMHAYLSSKACRRVRDAVAGDLCESITLDLLPRHAIWPEGFRTGKEGPTDGNIGVYFFPSMEQESAYDYLLYEMIRDDAAMRACVGAAELLVFSSTVLPPGLWRFQGKLFMWGIFIGKL